MEKIVTNSENTIKAYEFLKENEGQAFSIKQIAEALDVTSAKVLGGLTSLNNKGFVDKSEAVINEKTVKVYSANERQAEFTMEAPKTMSDKAVQVLQFLQNDGEGLTHKEIAQGMGLEHVASVVGVINSLVKKNLVSKRTEQVPVGEEMKELLLVDLTEAGREYKF